MIKMNKKKLEINFLIKEILVIYHKKKIYKKQEV